MKRHASHATFEEADIALARALDELDASVPNYNDWLRELVEPATHGTVLEVGAGVGTFTLALLKTAQRVVAVEPSTRSFEVLVQSTSHESRVVPIHGYTSDAAALGPFDGAVLSNVLEHIDDDEGTLKELVTLVRPGGLVAVFSPAFGSLMSDFDRSIGHVRRYRKLELRELFERAGFEIAEARYVNMPGFFAWLFVTRMFKKRPTRSALSQLYDRSIVPSTRWAESRIEPPFGQSVLVIGRVPRSV